MEVIKKRLQNSVYLLGFKEKYLGDALQILRQRGMMESRWERWLVFRVVFWGF